MKNTTDPRLAKLSEALKMRSARPNTRALGTVLSGSDVEKLLTAITSRKHRAILMTACGAGLRIGEVLALEVGDIDGKRMLIRVKDGKTGGRFSVMGGRLLAVLREYWKHYRPTGPLLFPGRDPNRTLTRAAVCKVFKKVVAEVLPGQRVTPHTLRHYAESVIMPSSVRDVRLGELRATDVTRFVADEARIRPRCVPVIVPALRVFLRCLQQRGDTEADLSGCVPAVAVWRLAALPKALPTEHVKRLLQHCGRVTAVGRRDYAMLLLLARLGLRAGELVSMELDDINWDSGDLVVRGKGGARTAFPCPAMLVLP